MTIAPGTYNFTINRGATCWENIAITGLTDKTGAVQDMTLYNARAKLVGTFGGTVLATFTISNEVKDALGNYSLIINLTATVTDALTFVTPAADTRIIILGHWDLELYTAADADVIRPLQGDVSLSLEATT